MAVFALRRSIEKIAAVELNPGLGCLDGDRPPAVGLNHPGSLDKSALASIEHPVLVIPNRPMELLVVLANAVAHRSGFAEVEGRARDRASSPVGISPESIGV